jgi:hypothetical protein
VAIQKVPTEASGRRTAGKGRAGTSSRHKTFSAGNNVIDYIRGDLIMSLGTILLIVLILILVGAIPTWPHSSGWGYYPSGGIGLVLVIVLILILLGKI